MTEHLDSLLNNSKMQNNKNEPETFINDSIKPPVDEASDKWFSDELAIVFQWITFATLCQAVGLFGVGSNIVNIICFVKQGFKDPVNVSFLGLAVADLCSLIMLTWSNLSFTPEFLATDLPFDALELQHLVSAMPHFAFTRISSWITALITLERCLCIIAPLKVKSIVTSKRVLVIIVCVYVILLASTAPFYIVNSLGLKFFPDRNKTLIGMVSTKNKDAVESVAYIINNACIPFGAFTTVIICTMILVIQLEKKTKWRKTSTVSTQADNVSTRNEKVAKMVVMVSVLFIFCFTPVCIIFIVMSLIPSISMVGKHRNVLCIFGGFGTLLESINSAANIFIYYEMSSKYKNVARQLLCLGNIK